MGGDGLHLAAGLPQRQSGSERCFSACSGSILSTAAADDALPAPAVQVFVGCGDVSQFARACLTHIQHTDTQYIDV